MAGALTQPKKRREELDNELGFENAIGFLQRKSFVIGRNKDKDKYLTM